jgi:enoyl-CoA hydratase
MKARGFLNRVTADADTAAQALASAQRIAALSPQAARLNKRTLRGAATDAYGYADSTEHREGIAAFLEKRSFRF